MSIKDQCTGCKFFGDASHCSQSVTDAYDGISCGKYQKKGISLEKEADKSIPHETAQRTNNQGAMPSTPVITPEYLKSITDIHGWLSFFFFAILAGSFLSLIFGIVQMDSADYSSSIWLMMCDIAIFSLYIIIAISTVIAFVKRRPDAVYLGMLYVVLIFLSNLIILITGNLDESSYMGSTAQVIRGVIWGVIWLCYLLFSEQVKDTIPKSYRKCTSLFYSLLAAVIIVPIFCIAAGIGEIAVKQSKQETSMLQRELKYGEYSDGRIIFEKPLGYTCENQEVETSGITVTIFSLENTAGNSFTICSDYASDFSRTQFEDYCSNWEDETAQSYPSNLISLKKYSVNGYPYYMKVTRYDIEDTYVYWMFALIYDSSSTKEVVVSFYSTSSDTEPIENLLTTIKFN